MRILFLGDIVGRPGRKIVREGVAHLQSRFGIDLTIANAENAAGGSGLNQRCYSQLASAGIAAFTMGDHIYKKKDIYGLFHAERPICKPVNFPRDAPGPDHLIAETDDGTRVAVLSVLGRVFMRPVDCPFAALDRVLKEIGDRAKVIVVDVHAEATSDKQLILRHLVGRVSAVLGTHTHVPTADAAVFPPGTAFMTDVGMTGPYDSIIGRRWEKVLHTTVTFEPTAFTVASGDPRLSGALVDVDPETGRAQAIEPLHIGEAELEVIASAVPAET